MATERLYYTDSRLYRFLGRVVEMGAVAGRPAVRLDRTAFYPTSGGQPNDTGMLTAENGLSYSVIDVIESEEDEAESEGSQVWHLLDRPAEFQPGEPLEGEVNPKRRLDHLAQHTGQHILSKAFDELLKAPTVSFHLGEEYSTIDIDRTSVTKEELASVERLANSIVRENRRVSVHLVSVDDLERFKLRKPTTRQGTIRVVEVQGFDASACGGTHARRTGEIGQIKIRRTERRSNNTTRVEFVAGERALLDYAQKQEIVRALADSFHIRESDLIATVGRLTEELDHLRAVETKLRARLRDYEAKARIESAASVEISGKKAKIVTLLLEEGAPDDLKRFAQAIIANASADYGVVALLGLLGAGKGQFVFARSPELSVEMGALLRQTCAEYGGRGGGTPVLAQGGLTDPSRLEDAIEWAKARLIEVG